MFEKIGTEKLGDSNKLRNQIRWVEWSPLVVRFVRCCCQWKIENVFDFSSVFCRDVFELMSQFVTAGSNNIVMLELDNPQ
jgi:hypothetical protein